MRRTLGCGIVLLLLASGCGLGSGGGGDERTVLVDYSHDQFASFMVGNFPDTIRVHPGTTVVFKQTWTGEPHTVTGGTLVDEMMSRGKPWMDFFSAFESLIASGADIPDPEAPEGPASAFFAAIEGADDEDASREALDAYDALTAVYPKLPKREGIGDLPFESLVKIVDEESNTFFEDLGVPWALDENEDEGFFVTQNAGQPCYLTSGGPPKDAKDPCAEADQEQPTFDGRHSYYNSGIIPYEGPQGNTYRVELAEDIEPGSYFFYCAVHGPDQSTEVEVVPENEDIPSQEAVSRQAREQIAGFSRPMLELYNDARDGTIKSDGGTLRGPFAGLSPQVHGSINEFVPRELTVEAGEPITWKMMGADHTITFDVPRYFPIIEFLRDGTVRLNPKLKPAAGGAPEPPEPPDDGPEDGEGGGPPQPMKIDGGTYDGTGFWSSGLIGSEPYIEYTLRISKPGTYRYACLLHPPMVGTVEVT